MGEAVVHRARAAVRVPVQLGLQVPWKPPREGLGAAFTEVRISERGPRFWRRSARSERDAPTAAPTNPWHAVRDPEFQRPPETDRHGDRCRCGSLKGR